MSTSRVKPPRSFSLTVLAVAALVSSLLVMMLTRNDAPVRVATPASNSASQSTETSSQWIQAPVVIVDTDDESGARLVRHFKQAGFLVELVAIDDLEKRQAEVKAAPIVWFTNAAANVLSPSVIRARMKEGPVVLDGYSPIADEVLRLDRPAKAVSTFIVSTKTNGIRPREKKVDTVHLDMPAQVLVPTVPIDAKFANLDNGSPALVRKGSLLWSFVRLDEGVNLERMPFLSAVISEQFAVESPMLRNDIDIYIDPDLEPGMKARDFAPIWKRAGITRVYLAAWKDDRRTNSGFDYIGFIQTMHEFGIEVMAWLEWPHVNFSFWKQHPQCIEKTAIGTNARIFWREHVALEVPECFDLAWNETKHVLDSAPFDGVNLAELYFEPAGEGPRKPSEYTPFHPYVRAEFERLYGFDPVLIVDPKSTYFYELNREAFSKWNAYREKLINDLHRKALDRLAEHRLGKNLMITVIDDRFVPEGQPFRDHLSVGQNIGANSVDLVKIAAEYGVEYQVEDPFTAWVETADRYMRIGQLYDDVELSKLVLDINIVERETALASGFLMTRTGGFELAESVSAVGASGARLAIYAASSIRTIDLPMLKSSLASGSTKVIRLDSTGSRIVVTSITPFELRLQRPASSLTIDGKVMNLPEPSRTVSLPAGTHKVRFHA